MRSNHWARFHSSKESKADPAFEEKQKKEPLSVEEERKEREHLASVKRQKNKLKAPKWKL